MPEKTEEADNSTKLSASHETSDQNVVETFTESDLAGLQFDANGDVNFAALLEEIQAADGALDEIEARVDRFNAILDGLLPKEKDQQEHSIQSVEKAQVSVETTQK